MKRVLLFVFSAIAFATLPSFSLAPALVIDGHSEMDVAFPYVNPCTGVLLDITGHEEYNLHVVDNGKRVNISAHARGQYRATDADGHTYVGHYSDNFSESYATTAGALYVSNEAFKVHFVGQGGVKGFDLIARVHVTVTPNGVTTVDRLSDEVVCD